MVGLRAGRNGSLDQTYQGLASLVESYLRGDPIATTDVNNRLAEYASVFAGYAQSAAEIVALVAANPGTIVTLPPDAPRDQPDHAALVPLSGPRPATGTA